MDNANIPKMAGRESRFSDPDPGHSSPSVIETAVPKRRRRAAASGASDDCFACQKRQVRCDRRRPYCTQCLEVGKDCSGYRTSLTWGVGLSSRGKLRGLSLPIASWPKTAQGPVENETERSKASGPDVKVKNEETNSPFGFPMHLDASAESRFSSPLSLGVPSLSSTAPTEVSTDFDRQSSYCNTWGSSTPEIPIQSPLVFHTPQSSYSPFILNESPRGGGTDLLRYSAVDYGSIHGTGDNRLYPNSYVPSPMFVQGGVSGKKEPAASSFASYIQGERMISSSGLYEPRCWEHGCNGRVFPTWSNLLRHRRAISGSARTPCPECGAVSIRKTVLSGHPEQEECKRHHTPPLHKVFEPLKQKIEQRSKEDPLVKREPGNLSQHDGTQGNEIPRYFGGIGVLSQKPVQIETILGLNHSEPDSVISSPRPTGSTSSSGADDINSPPTDFTISSSSEVTSTASTESVDMKEVIIRRLMTDLHRILARNQMPEGSQQDQLVGQESSQSSEAREKLPVEEGRGTKRSRSSVQNNKKHGEETQPNDNDDDENLSRRKRQRTEIRDEDDSLRLACPYFKRDPRKYRNWRSCLGPGWPSVHRLKEHLYRCHKLPIQCPRCCGTFKSESLLLEHQRQDVACDRRDAPKMEGFDKTQEARLKSRKKDKDATTEREKWNSIYRILFPDDDPNRLPSPYFDESCFKQLSLDGNQESDWAQYEGFLKRELPASFRRELESRLDRLWSSAEQDMRQQIPEFFQEMQIKLYQEFKRTRNEACASSQNSGKGDDEEARFAPQPLNLEQWQLPTSFENAVDGSSIFSDGSIPMEFEGIRYELEPNDFAFIDQQGSDDMIFGQLDYEL